MPLKHLRVAPPILLLFILLTATSFASAQVAGGANGESGGQPGLGGQPSALSGGQPPSTYLRDLYLWFLGFVGLAALLMIVLGGVTYMLAGANITKTELAKKWIANALWGVTLAAASVLLLRTINPDLVQDFNLETIIQRAQIR